MYLYKNIKRVCVCVYVCLFKLKHNKPYRL